VFAIALALVCVYQLSFTWVTSSVESDAREYAQGDPLKERIYLDSIAGQPVYDFLFLREYTYRDCQEKEINLGLDLKGGMNVTLEVSVPDLIVALSGNSKDSTFVKAIRMARERRLDSQEDFITLFAESFAEIDPGAQMASVFATFELKDKVKFDTSNDDVIKVLREQTQVAIDNSFNILRSRIDRFGVSQPNIQRLEGNGSRILVELPGVKEPERVRKLLQGTAQLEFWETYDNSEVFPFLQQANERLAAIQAAEQGVDTAAAMAPAVADSTAQVAATEADSTALAAAPDSAAQAGSLLDELAQTQDSAALAQANIEEFRKNNPLFTLLNPAVSQEGQLSQGAAVGFALSRDTAQVGQYLRMAQIRALFPRDLSFHWEFKAIGTEQGQENIFRLVAIKKASANRDGSAPLTGEAIVQARQDFDPTSGAASVDMNMNTEGSRVWARLTKENIGKQVAILLDGYVYSYPVVNQEIRGGRSQITGDFTIVEAKDLANILESGRLPAPARIIEEEIVGPSLGQESIDAGLYSFLIAFLLVMIYMVMYYKSAGVVADIALMANLFFIFGVLASLRAVLTLPGIAGIVLTIGMSVDANVLIFERVREEIRNGKGLKLAVTDGYKNAYSAIIDANITTLITGIILYVFGHGPVKGFATTLIIGILTSLFAAIFLTRLIFIWMMDRDKPVSFSTKLTENVFKNVNIDFIGKRKIAYIASSVVIVLGLVSLLTRGLNQGVDFVGGRSYVVAFEQPIQTTEVAEALETVYGTAPEVKTFGGDNQVKITTKFMIESEDPNADSIVEAKLYEGLAPLIPGIDRETFLEVNRRSSQKVGPTIADDIKVSAVYSIFFALALIFLYIFARFRNWQFGLGAVASLAHDVLIVIGLFSMLYGFMPFSLEIDQAFIAAILTVVGYSINDTVVVFDRIREHFALHKQDTREKTYNNALNDTLSRTLGTSFTTLLVLFAIFLFGGEVIRGFTFALITGIMVGTYSSIFVATPIVYDTFKRQEVAKAEKEKKGVTPKKPATEPKPTKPVAS